MTRRPGRFQRVNFIDVKHDVMDEQKRLELIVEAVRYTQRVKALGMPLGGYTKALREPIHFLWERRSGKSKDACAQFRSKAAAGLQRGAGTLLYDHAVPFRYMQKELLDLPEVTCDSVRAVLDKYGVVVLVTRREYAPHASGSWKENAQGLGWPRSSRPLCVGRHRAGPELD
jgi:hypothetical protein